MISMKMRNTESITMNSLGQVNTSIKLIKNCLKQPELYNDEEYARLKRQLAQLIQERRYFTKGHGFGN